MQLKDLVVACVMSTALAFPISALAGPIPPSVVEGVVFLRASSLASDPGQFLDIASTPGIQAGTASAAGSSSTGLLQITAGPAPLVSASAILTSSLSPLSGSDANVRGFQKYFFQIDGPSDMISVRVDAFGEVSFNSLSSLGYGTSSALLQVRENNNGSVVFVEDIGISGSNLGYVTSLDQYHYTSNPRLSFSVGGNFLFKTNTVYEVIQRVIVTGTGYGSGATDLFGNVDPMFTVDGPYSFQFSNGYGGGIVNSGGAVPEPAVWALMLMGFCSVGAALRRRRVAVAA